MSTRSEVEKCKEVIFKALNLKKNGNKQQFYAEFKNQTFLNGASEPRFLRLWMKAFLETLPQIILDFKDTELVDLLMFTLPWLCHGKKSVSELDQGDLSTEVLVLI